MIFFMRTDWDPTDDFNIINMEFFWCTSTSSHVSTVGSRSSCTLVSTWLGWRVSPLGIHESSHKQMFVPSPIYHMIPWPHQDPSVTHTWHWFCIENIGIFQIFSSQNPDAKWIRCLHKLPHLFHQHCQVERVDISEAQTALFLRPCHFLLANPVCTMFILLLWLPWTT
jgi:hypothetical protein